MSKLWEDLKENMRDWSASAVEKAEEVSRMAMAKTEEMTRISKIKFEIHQLQRQMNKGFEKLGKLAYSRTKEDHMATFSGNTDFFKIVSRVEKIREEISHKENEIENIKLEYGINDNDLNNQSNLSNLEMESDKKLENEIN
ncbi:MAG: hypothetical protein CMG05_04080 [Candidatus Marinimicrobia bacterium]|nr:hypothetical protein [Candidatus Neomarinimicrobiota bacterium]|tara:strand:- start:140 stop:562 length:423 start_codon:yes stop_codon:yes gene_type:complete